MKPSGVVLCVVFAFFALAGTVWIGRYRAETPDILKAKEKPVELGPPISPSGPYPKAMTDEVEYNFGTLPMGAEGQHVFTIRNEGQADLVLMARKEDTTCSCTFGELGNDGAVKPGESTTVTLNWKVKLPSSEFRHRATVRTNDPERKEIELTIAGEVAATIRLEPDQNWPLGEIKAKEPTTFTGRVYSTVLDEFAIKSLLPGKPVLNAEQRPLEPDELKTLGAKSGYAVTLTVSPDVAIGPFSDTVKVTTDNEHNPELSFTVSGLRRGPLEFLGPNYQPEVNALLLGEFPANKGKDAALSVFALDFDGELQLEDVKQEFNSLQISLEKDQKFAGKQNRYRLKISIPPGPPQDHRRKKAEKVDLFFNHPDARQIRLIVDFLATPSDA